MDEKEKITLIVKKKHMAAGSHGGAWKIAYADFVTAMMAFFLLLWLLNATTESQMMGISEYFTPNIPGTQDNGTGKSMKGLSMADSTGSKTSSTPSNKNQTAPSKGMKTYGKTPLESNSENDLKFALENTVQQKHSDAESEIIYSITAEQMNRISHDINGKIKSIMIDEIPKGTPISILESDSFNMFQGDSNLITKSAKQAILFAGNILLQHHQKIFIKGDITETQEKNKNDNKIWNKAFDRVLAIDNLLLNNGYQSKNINAVILQKTHQEEYKTKSDRDQHSNKRNKVSILVSH